MGGGYFKQSNQKNPKILIGVIVLLIGSLQVSALTSNEVTYENEGISETLTNTIDTLYRELKEYRTNGTVTNDKMLEGYTGYSKGKLIIGSIPSKGSTTYTPGVNNQVITKGQYLSEDQVILGDVNLVSENIKEGIEIFGIKGSIKDNSGKTLEASSIIEKGENAEITIPRGYYTEESKISIPIETISQEISSINSSSNALPMYDVTKVTVTSLTPTASNSNTDKAVLNISEDAYYAINAYNNNQSIYVSVKLYTIDDQLISSGASNSNGVWDSAMTPYFFLKAGTYKYQGRGSVVQLYKIPILK